MSVPSSTLGSFCLQASVRLVRSIVPGVKPGVGAERLKTDGEQQFQVMDSKSSNWRSYSSWDAVPEDAKHRLMTEMDT